MEITIKKDGKNIPDSLGMTEKRGDYFITKAKLVNFTNKNFTTAMVQLAKLCKNTNELAFAMYCVGMVRAKEQAKGETHNINFGTTKVFWPTFSALLFFSTSFLLGINLVEGKWLWALLNAVVLIIIGYTNRNN